MTDEGGAEGKEESLKAKEEPSFDLNHMQIEVYRNDAKWKNIRRLLAVAGIVPWIALLAGCILLVYFSPPCDEIDTSQIWPSAVLYNLWIPSFQDSNGDGMGDIIGVTNRLISLRRIGVRIVWPDPLLKSGDLNDLVKDFKVVDPKLGTIEDIDTLIAKIHANGMKIVMTIPISFTSDEHEWFIASSKKNSDLTELYHWSETGIGSSQSFFSNAKNLYYGHVMGAPESPLLNWESKKLMALMVEVFSFWIDKGIDGFNLAGLEHISQWSKSEKQIKRYIEILPVIREHIDQYINKTYSGKKQIMLFTRLEKDSRDFKEKLSNSMDSIINYELKEAAEHGDTCKKLGGAPVYSTCIINTIQEELQFYKKYNIWPMWELGYSQISRIVTRAGRHRAEILSILQPILPGPTVIYYGEEIEMSDLTNALSANVHVQRSAMQWDDTTNAGFSTASTLVVPLNNEYVDRNWKKMYRSRNSHLNTRKALYLLKGTDRIFSEGETSIKALLNHTFAIVRYNSQGGKNVTGSIYLAVANFGTSKENIILSNVPPLNKLKILSAEVLAVSSNENNYLVRQIIELTYGTFYLSPESCIVLKFIV